MLSDVCSFGWEGEGWCEYTSIHPVLQRALRSFLCGVCSELVDGMGPKGWNESGMRGPGPVNMWPWCAFSGSQVQTQRRCSIEGSSVDSSLGLAWSPKVRRVGSSLWVAPRGSCVRLVSCMGAGGAACKIRITRQSPLQPKTLENLIRAYIASLSPLMWRTVFCSKQLSNVDHNQTEHYRLLANFLFVFLNYNNI